MCIRTKLHWTTQLLKNAVGVFAAAAEKQTAGPDLRNLHAKIGLQTLAIVFLLGELSHIGHASAKR